MAHNPAGKARASARAALEFMNKEVDPSCTECTDTPPVRAVILYPNLGTPLILAPGDKKLNFFIAAEGRSKELFGVMSKSSSFPQPAVIGYMYVDKHLRVYPITEKKMREDTKDGRLWNDGKVCSTAFKHVKVWCLGPLDSTDAKITDIEGKTFAHIRPGTIARYNNTSPAHPDANDPLAENRSLDWIYQIQIDIGALPNAPSTGALVSLAWMVELPACYKKEKALAGVSDWEYQDKLIYDFLEGQKNSSSKHHLPDLYEFDVRTATPGKLPQLRKTAPRRLMAWHPISIGITKTLKIGHLSDVHINSRQFALGNSDARVMEGVSEKLGPKIDNCFIALRELFEGMKAAGADAIFLTGDLLDFNRNLDPRELKSSHPKDQWPIFDIVQNIGNGKLYPRGIDDMLIFSLLRYSYEKLCMPVFLTTGNHEAYDIPYGISPRANAFVAAQAYNQVATQEAVVTPARLRGAVSVATGISNAFQYIPLADKAWRQGSEELLKKAMKKLEATTDPNQSFIAGKTKRMNDAIPAEHNLTIYEACLIYGPSFAQVVAPFNFKPENLDWFFTLFTPLSDYRIDYADQVLLGLDWGDSEIMVNSDMGAIEAYKTVRGPDEVMGAISGLPRADKSLSQKQKLLIAEAQSSKKKLLMFTHFTFINYHYPYALDRRTVQFAASDNVFNQYTRGTFSIGREWLYPRLNNGIHYTLSGHSHRSGVYCLDNTNAQAMTAVGYQPAEYGKPDAYASKMHTSLFPTADISRIAVSSSGGPLGVQNIKGELFGWNMMPPSGTLVDINVTGPLELQRIVTKQYSAAKPRFCVALDYIQVLEERQVISWIPLDDYAGHYWVVVGNVLEPKPFLAKMTFFVWGEKDRKFDKYIVGLAPKPGHLCVYEMALAGYENFFRQALSKKATSTPHIFVQIDFNQALSNSPIYEHYNFQDPWIFRVDVEFDPGHPPRILPANGQRAEIPDWEWLAAVDPSRYPTPPGRKLNKIG